MESSPFQLRRDSTMGQDLTAFIIKDPLIMTLLILIFLWKPIIQEELLVEYQRDKLLITELHLNQFLVLQNHNRHIVLMEKK